MNNNEMKKENDEYNALFDEFINSSEDKLFSKQEVKKIIEAHMYKNILSKFDDDDEIESKPRNILVTTKELSLRIFNVKTIFNFLLTYLFYVGFLVLILNFIYTDLITDKYTIFIIAFVFALVDKIVKPLVFFGDLLSFTIHKIGLISITIYSVIFFVLTTTISGSRTVTIEKSIVVALIVLFLTFIIEFIKRDSFFKAKYIDDDEMGSETDE